MAHGPALDSDRVDLADQARFAGLAHPQPEHVALRRRDEGPQQRRVRQPLLQQSHRRARQVQALLRRAALDIGQQDRGVTGPVDVAGDQVRNAIRDDARVDAEQQPVGNHGVEVRERAHDRVVEAAAAADHRIRYPQVRPELADAGRPEAGQQPVQVRRLPPAGAGTLRAGSINEHLAVGGIGVVGHLPADPGQALPVSIRIRRQRPAESLDVEVPACGQLEHALAQAAAGPGEALDHAAGQGLQPHRPGHPELGQLTPPQIGGAAGEASRGEGADHGPQGLDIEDDRAAGIRGPVRVDQVRQACSQVTGQTRAGQVVQVILGPAAVAEHAPDAQRRLDDHRRHQAPPSQGSPLNSSAASLSAPVSPASPAAAPAPSYACR